MSPSTTTSLNEGNETVNLQLVEGTDVVDSAQLSIVDDDNPLPSVQFAKPTYSVNEGGTTATVTVTLSKAVDGDVTVHYATADGTATAGTTATDGTADYENTSGTLTFLGNTNAPGGVGETSKTDRGPAAPRHGRRGRRGLQPRAVGSDELRCSARRRRRP